MSFAQDVSTTKKGTKFRGKMIEVEYYEVKFKGEGILGSN